MRKAPEVELYRIHVSLCRLAMHEHQRNQQQEWRESRECIAFLSIVTISCGRSFFAFENVDISSWLHVKSSVSGTDKFGIVRRFACWERGKRYLFRVVGYAKMMAGWLPMRMNPLEVKLENVLDKLERSGDLGNFLVAVVVKKER
jgi:hypothetical protein